MIPYLGDFVEDDVVYLMFNTFSSDDPSASVTITNFINTDVHIHKDDGLTQRNNAAGITVSVNFDGITGSHMIKIDASDNTVAGFWVTGHDYFVRIEGTTIDGATINAVVGHFSIQNRFMRGTNSANTVVPDAAGVAPTVGEIRTEMEGAGSKLLAIEGYTDKIDDATNGLTAIKAEVEGLAGAAMRGTDGANTTVPDAAGVAPTSAEIKTEIEQAGSSLAQILADTNELELDWKDTGRLDNLLDAIPTTAMRGTDGANTTVPDVAGTLATYDPPTRTEATADKDAIIADLLTMKKKAAGTWNRETDSLEAIRDRGDAAWVTATGFSTHNAADVKTAIEQAGSSIAQILADTNEMELDWKNGGRLDLILDIIAADTTTDIPGLILKYTQLLARSDAAIATDNATELTAINADGGSGAGDFSNQTDGIEAIRDRGDSAWITATGFSTHSAANVWTSVTRALTDKSGFALSAAGANLILKDSTFALAIADAIWDEILTGALHNIVNSAGRRVREIGAYAIESGTAQAATSNNITLAATASANDGVYNRSMIVIVDNTGIGQTRTIVDYDGTTKVAVIDRDWRVTPDATTTYQITADNTPLVVDQGVAQGGTSTTITLREYASAIDDTYLCNVVAIIAGTGRGQARLVGAYNGTTKVVTVCGDNWVTNPDVTSVYVMMPYGTTCTSCVGTYALGLINTECDTALTDYAPNTTVPDAAGTAAGLHTTTDGKVDAVQTDATAIKAKTDNLPSGMAKNVAVPKFDIFMVLSSDHVTGATGKVVTGTISKDGGAFAALTNSIAEVSGGMYTIASGLTQAERNADVSTLRFSAADCDDRIITIISS